MNSTTSFKKYSNSNSHQIDANEHNYLYIKGSQIPESGKGLFTAISIYKDEVVSIFKGKILSDTEAQRRAANGDDANFINMPDGTVMDSMTVNCFTKYAYDASGLIQSSFKNNSRITLSENSKVCNVATNRLSVGAEIFCGYGNGHWKNVRRNNAN